MALLVVTIQIFLCTQNGTIFRQEYARYLHNVSRFELSENVYSEQCYDATWTLAYALNGTLSGMMTKLCSLCN